jgi:hypothetical protein
MLLRPVWVLLGVVSVVLTIAVTGCDNDSYTNTSRLLAENRDRLAICIDAVDVAPEYASTVRSAVERTLPKFALTSAWARRDLSNPAPHIDEGCPEPTMYAWAKDAASTPQPYGFFARRFRDEDPSYYKVHVYVLPEKPVDRLTEVYGLPLAAEEFSCSGDSCRQVTTGVYLTPESMSNTEFVSDLLARAIGLK